MRKLLIILLCFFLGGCSSLSVPRGIYPVQQFNIYKFQGKWYEIARLDHPSEQGLEHVTAEYSLNESIGENKSLTVINRGFSRENNEWEEAEGKLTYVHVQNDAFFKISFGWPAQGSYTIFDLDKNNYQYAFVTGSDRNFLWLLSRTPKVSAKLMDHFLSTSKKLGFDTDKLIYVTHPTAK